MIKIVTFSLASLMTISLHASSSRETISPQPSLPSLGVAALHLSSKIQGDAKHGESLSQPYSSPYAAYPSSALEQVLREVAPGMSPAAIEKIEQEIHSLKEKERKNFSLLK